MASFYKVKFGPYVLPNIAADGVREAQGPNRDITVVKTSGVRGSKVLDVVDEDKLIEVVGKLIVSTGDELAAETRAFVKAMAQKAYPLTITPVDGEGQFVYDGCYVTNFSELVGLKSFAFRGDVDYRVVFMAPKGFARSITQTSATFANITTAPYNDSILIDGDTNPEPVIQVTVTTPSTIAALYFTNKTVNQQISITGQTFAAGDVVLFDIANQEVRLNNTRIIFDGVFPEFGPGLNEFQLAIGGASNLIIDQHTYNSESPFYGSLKVAAKFQPGSSFSVAQLGLLLKKVSAVVNSLVDDFSGDLSGWTTSGHVGIVSGQIAVGAYAVDPSGDAEAVSVATFPQGGYLNWYRGNVGSPSATKPLVEFTNPARSKRITFTHTGGNNFEITTAGYGGGSASGNIGGGITVSVEQVGSDIQVKLNSDLWLTLTGQTLDSDTRVAWRTYGEGGADTSNETVYGDNVNKYVTAAANGDITVTIQTNSGGNPSGTPVTNGTLTILASEVGTDNFGEIIKEFVAGLLPALVSGTIYHLVLVQSGGDVNNYYLTKKQNTDVLANANFSTYNGSSWTQVTGEDMYFKVWSTQPAAFRLDMIIRFFASYFNVG